MRRTGCVFSGGKTILPRAFALLPSAFSALDGAAVVVAGDDEGAAVGELEGLAAFAGLLAGFGVGAGEADAVSSGLGVGVGAVDDCALAVWTAASRRRENNKPLIMIDDSCVFEEIAPRAGKALGKYAYQSSNAR
jgi:hypothetical protein